MADRATTRAPYRAAQMAARARANKISRQQLQAVRRAVKRNANRWSARLAKAPAGDFAAAARLNLQASLRLEAELTFLIERARVSTFDDVLKIYEGTAERVAAAEGIDLVLLGAVQAPPVSLLGAYELTPGATSWRTALTGYAQNMRVDLDDIVRDAFAGGIGPDALAMRLRPYVAGADDLRKALGPLDFDKRAILARKGPVAQAAKKMRHNAARIAFSEQHSARAEAEVQHFISDPLVKAVAWRLAPDRGTLAGPDECDYLAEADLFGLGPGVFPVGEVPGPPHPWDRCERVPINRPASEAADKKPNPGLQKDPLKTKIARLTPRGKAGKIRERFAALIAATPKISA